MFHLITQIRPHRTPMHSSPVMNHSPAEDLADAVLQARKQMRDNFADPVEFQNEDRTTFMDQAAFMAEVNKEK